MSATELAALIVAVSSVVAAVLLSVGVVAVTRTLRALRLVRDPMSDELADRVWQMRHNSSAYVASFVALAEFLNVPLVTAERRLAEGVRELTTIPVESYAAA